MRSAIPWTAPLIEAQFLQNSLFSKNIRMTNNRQLAAILFTDIVGYAALMGLGESRALRVAEQAKAIQQTLVQQYDVTQYDVNKDGSQIYTGKYGRSRQIEIRLVQNWLEKLVEVVPVK